MTYTVKYKKVGGIFWKKIKNVTDDAIMSHEVSSVTERQADKAIKIFSVRILFLEDKRRVEIPIENCIIEFSKERFFSIQEKMEKESGIELDTDL